MTNTLTPAARAAILARLEFQNGRLVKVAGMRPEHLDGFSLIQLVHELAAVIQTDPEPKHPDDEAVERFAAAMKTKLRKKRAEGRSGWDGPECDANVLSGLLREHVEKGDPLDVGNLSMMLHQRGERIQTAPEPQQVVDVRTEDLRLLRRADQMLKDYDEGHSLKAKDVLLLLRDDLAKRATPSSASVEAVPDHPPFDVPEVYNYYGHLALKRENGKDYWSIGCYDGHSWVPCDPNVAAALRALEPK